MINYTPSFFTSSLSHSYTSPRNTRKDWTRQMELPIAAAVAVPEVGATASLPAATEAMDQTIASATTINGTNASSSCSSTSKKVFTIQPPRGPPVTFEAADEGPPRKPHELQRYYTTKCGKRIYVPDKTLEHMASHPEVDHALFAEVCSKMSLPPVIRRKKLPVEVNLERSVGRICIIETKPVLPNERTVFACRKGRVRPSRVVVQEDAQGPETTYVTCFMYNTRQRSGERLLILVTAYTGRKVEREPLVHTMNVTSETKDMEKALSFWSSHAFIHDPEGMQPVFESTWQDVLARKKRKIGSAALRAKKRRVMRNKRKRKKNRKKALKKAREEEEGEGGGKGGGEEGVVGGSDEGEKKETRTMEEGEEEEEEEEEGSDEGEGDDEEEQEKGGRKEGEVEREEGEEDEEAEGEVELHELEGLMARYQGQEHVRETRESKKARKKALRAKQKVKKVPQYHAKMGEAGSLTLCARTHRDLEFVLSDHLTQALPSMKHASVGWPVFGRLSVWISPEDQADPGKMLSVIEELLHTGEMNALHIYLGRWDDLPAPSALPSSPSLPPYVDAVASIPPSAWAGAVAVWRTAEFWIEMQDGSHRTEGDQRAAREELLDMWGRVHTDPAAFLASAPPLSFFVQEKIQGKQTRFPPSLRLSRLVADGMKKGGHVGHWPISLTDFSLEMQAHHQEDTLSLSITLPLIHPSVPAWSAEGGEGGEGGGEGGGRVALLEGLKARLHRDRLRVPIAFALARLAGIRGTDSVLCHSVGAGTLAAVVRQAFPCGQLYLSNETPTSLQAICAFPPPSPPSSLPPSLYGRPLANPFPHLLLCPSTLRTPTMLEEGGLPPSLPPFLPFRDNSLDVIVGDFALESPLEEHMHDVQSYRHAMREFRRVLKMKGKLVMVSQARRPVFQESSRTNSGWRVKKTHVAAVENEKVTIFVIQKYVLPHEKTNKPRPPVARQEEGKERGKERGMEGGICGRKAALLKKSELGAFPGRGRVEGGREGRKEGKHVGGGEEEGEGGKEEATRGS